MEPTAQSLTRIVCFCPMRIKFDFGQQTFQIGLTFNNGSIFRKLSSVKYC